MNRPSADREDHEQTVSGTRSYHERAASGLRSDHERTVSGPVVVIGLKTFDLSDFITTQCL